MINPDFWTDSRIRKMSPVERLLFIGLISHADDEGRLIAEPPFLRSAIFPYDDFSLDDVKQMRDHIAQINPNVIIYRNDDSDEELIQFKKWRSYQKPRYSKESKLPPPADFNQKDETLPQGFNQKDETLPQAFNQKDENLPLRSGQSSQGKNSIGQDNPPPLAKSLSEVNFTNRPDNDLIDYLTSLLEQNIPRGPFWGAEVIMHFWEQCIGKSNPAVVSGARTTLKSYPPRIIAQALVKAKNYGAGKHHSWKYVEQIVKEELGKQTKKPIRGTE
jgi:hypothetical protein